MKTNLLSLLLLALIGCAPTKVSLRQLQEYDMAIRMAQANGADQATITEMHEKFMVMMKEYIKNPGEDPYVTAARDAADAQMLMGGAAMMQVTKPPPYVPPMSPGEYRRASQ